MDIHRTWSDAARAWTGEAPRGYAQVLDETDFAAEPKPDFPSNYARSKAEAERLVCGADSPAGVFRTGCIRPGNGIYGPLLRFRDLHVLLAATSRSGRDVRYSPPVLVWAASHLVELYCLLLARWPRLLRRVAAREPADPLVMLQPGTLDSSVTQMARDDVARRAPGEGGLGYGAYCSTVEGVSLLVGEWNARQEKMSLLK
ncbi:hypothetical protein E4U21_006168 [Claviceps maximensis]|nr:hypothetical protein E4U21_006168 [Claviceps maximensis]